MKAVEQTSPLKLILCLSLAISLCAGILIGDVAKASAPRPFSHDSGEGSGRTDKVTPGLLARARNDHSGDDTVQIILQLNGKVTGQLNALLNRNGVHVHQIFKNFNSRVVELPARVVEELADYTEVSYVSLDTEVATMGHLESTTGAMARRSQTATTGTAFQLDGTGVGIAILDSGIYANHKSFLNAAGASRVLYSKDFTGENRTDDPYGHGTHVAAMAAGNRLYYSGAYSGIAPNANLINLRVLDQSGKGKTSGILSALDWVLTNSAAYNIRVVNMSLGAPAIESYKNDPLCKAVRRLVDAGLVVVAAAGNDGKNSAGQKVYGRIHVPGNEPSAITVGASNSYGTDSRSDDTITSFSSRGPTRSYWTDTAGNRHYDNLIKPDMVAPGNKIISAESPGSLLIQLSPALDTLLSLDATNKMMYMSGTSMATPAVAGAAALLFQLKPTLTPNLVKMILMYTAQPLAGFNHLEQGAGELNVAGAVDLAKLVRTDLSATTALGASLLTSATAPTTQSTIASYTFTWSQGLVLNQNYAKGAELITHYQKVYGMGTLLGDGVKLSNGVLIGDTTKLSSGILFGDQILKSNGLTMSGGTVFCSVGVLIGDGVLVGDGVLIGDGVLVGDSISSDGVLVGDSVTSSSILTNGDLTSCMW